MSWNELYVVDLFSIALFVLSYYRNCYRKSYRFDFWHAQLFLYCVLPNMFMLPFAKGEQNVIVLGQDFASVVAVLPSVFLITTLGYVAVLTGGALWSMKLGAGLRKAAISLLAIGPRSSMMLMRSRNLLVFQSVVCLALQASAIGLYFSQSGFGFDLRGYTFANPALRPIALVITNYSVVIGSHCFARYVEKKERSLLLCTLSLTAGLVFFGSRANLLSIYLAVAMCYLVQLRSKVSLFRMFSVISALMAFGFYLGNVRAGQYSLGEFFSSIIFLAFYGNNFSDLRDFAWVYAAWNHTPWIGKTYLAAAMSVVPRFASQFRDTWGSGVAMDLTVGLDPQVHPGLRPGAFGEAFFNFGFLGVIAVGIIIGIVVRRVDIDVKLALQSPKPSMIAAFASTILLNIAACAAVSATLSGVYVLAGIYLFSWLCLRVGALLTWRPARIA